MAVALWRRSLISVFVRVKPTDPLTYVAVAIGLALVDLLDCYIQRAAPCE